MKIVVDSCCELTEEMKLDEKLISVPLRINVDGKEFVDDETLDVDSLLDSIDQFDGVAKTSCPSPDDFLRAFEGDEDVFVVNLTGALSGTYNSAILAKSLCEELNPKKRIHVFNTNSASINETLVAMRIKRLINDGHSFDEIVKKIYDYMDDMKFFFHIGVLDTLVKNGRMTKIQGKLANLLNIKLIMTASKEGEIEIYEKTRTTKKAMRRLVEIIGEVGDGFEEKVLGISYCDCFDKANSLKHDILSRYPFKEVVMLKMRGLSSTYANRGGIILSF